MKKWVLYIMSVVFCMGFFACTAEDDLTDNSADQGKEVMVSFTLNIPDSRNASDTEEGTAWESYIDEVRIFAFVNDRYKEEVRIISFDENDGNQTRTLFGKMKSDYDAGKNLELVILTNMKSRGVKEPTLAVDETNKQGLYEQLVFNYTEPWKFSEGEKKYIPMWGITTKFDIKEDTETYRIYDAGTIYMHRAVAKINITVAGGEGIEGFIIEEVKLYNVPDKGYCASLNTPSDNYFNKPSFPSDMKALATPLPVYTNDNGTEKTRKIENKIYVPEMGWTSATAYKPMFFYIQINAQVNGNRKEYNIYMREQQGDPYTTFDIIRNHIYTININSLTIDEFKFTYMAIPWGISNVHIPGFD